MALWHIVCKKVFEEWIVQEVIEVCMVEGHWTMDGTRWSLGNVLDDGEYERPWSIMVQGGHWMMDDIHNYWMMDSLRGTRSLDGTRSLQDG